MLQIGERRIVALLPLFTLIVKKQEDALQISYLYGRLQ